MGATSEENSQYSEDQKNILYVLFIKGQKSKKKVTPEEAVAEIRKKLPVDQFVKPKQVKVSCEKRKTQHGHSIP